MASHRKSNAGEKGHGSQPMEYKNEGNGREPFNFWICGRDHHKKDCPLYYGGMPQIYGAQEE